MPLSFRKISSDSQLGRPLEMRSEVASFSGDIFVMPKEFYVPFKAQKGRNEVTWLLLLVGLIVVAFGAAALYVLVIQKQSLGTGEPDSNLTTGSIEERDSTESSAPQSTSTPEVGGEPTATTTEPVGSATGAWSALALLPSSLDIDEDGLTDIEEVFFGTDVHENDSDGDSFTDGREVLSGYDPAKRGVALLESALFTNVVVEEPHLNLIVPQSWTKTEDTKEVRVVLTALNGDSIIIDVEKKASNKTLDEWVDTYVTGLKSSTLLERVLDAIPVALEPGGRRVFISVGDSIVIVSYDVGKKLEVAYPTIWEYVLSSITIL